MTRTKEYGIPLCGLTIATLVLGLGFFASPAYAANCNTTRRCTAYSGPGSIGFEGTCGASSNGDCVCKASGLEDAQEACKE